MFGRLVTIKLKAQWKPTVETFEFVGSAFQQAMAKAA